jgi:redox-sensitive bicupin YhaK (pirin superfamily)
MQKTIKSVRKAAAPHWVGDGFKVRNFIGRDLWHDLSPFLMLDYNEPWQVLPSDHPRGVDVHPHKGFETVTIAWQGKVAHEDSTGGKGVIGPGDVQWMTAGSGILHKEFHAEDFAKTGGTFHMAQLWVNLPAKFKNTPPRYQDLLQQAIPVVQLPGDAGALRVISGEFNGTQGPANTYSRITIYDVNLNAGGHLHIQLPDGDSTAVIVMSGNILLNDEQQARGGDMAVFNHLGSNVSIESNNESHLLVLSGEPIKEPIAAYGPFVMNTQQEIMEAMDDFNAGKFGMLS